MVSSGVEWRRPRSKRIYALSRGLFECLTSNGKHGSIYPPSTHNQTRLHGLFFPFVQFFSFCLWIASQLFYANGTIWSQPKKCSIEIFLFCKSFNLLEMGAFYQSTFWPFELKVKFRCLNSKQHNLITLIIKTGMNFESWRCNSNHFFVDPIGKCFFLF